MVQQNFHAWLGGAADFVEDHCKRAGIAPRLVHETGAISIGGCFGLARIARLQHGLGGQHDRAASDEVAEQHPEQERQPGALQHGLGAVAVRDVTDFVGDDAGDLVGGFGLVDETTEHVDLPAGQRYSVGLIAAHHVGAKRKRQRRRRFKPPHDLVQCRASRCLRRGLAAIESGARMPWIKHAADLHVDRIAQLALDRGRQQGGQALGDGRHPEPGDQQQGRRGTEGPPDHGQPLAALQHSRAVDKCGARVDFGGECGVGDFQALEHRAVAASEAEQAVRSRKLFQLSIPPFAQNTAVMAEDLQARVAKLDTHVMARAGHAVEINGGAG